MKVHEETEIVLRQQRHRLSNLSLVLFMLLKFQGILSFIDFHFQNVLVS
jgi:hypothetical protein